MFNHYRKKFKIKYIVEKIYLIEITYSGTNVLSDKHLSRKFAYTIGFRKMFFSFAYCLYLLYHENFNIIGHFYLL